jgi:hypothetical protein
VDDLQARRDRLVRLCRTLPEATVTTHDRHLGFQVRGRTFAWFVDDEHGDGRVAVLCKAPPGENRGLVASDPHRFYLPRYVGSRGWVAIWSASPPAELHCRGASPSRGFWLRSG